MIFKRLTFAICIILCSSATLSRELLEKLVQPPEVCEPGYEKGVSAQFYGYYNEGLIVAGGANFPERPAAEGGQKRFYRTAYILKKASHDAPYWLYIGELEEPAAYGASIRYHDEIIIVGGSNENGAINTATAYTLRNDTLLKSRTLPPLPAPTEQCVGVVSDNDVLYIIGGLANSKPSAAIYALNLHDLAKGWELSGNLPCAVVQPVAVAHNNNLYIWGGFFPGDGTQKPLLYTQGWQYKPTTQTTTTLPAPPTKNLTGATAYSSTEGYIKVVGGVNSTLFLEALNRRYEIAKCDSTRKRILLKEDYQYMTMPIHKYKFSNQMLLFDIEQNKWSIYEISEKFARAGAVAHNLETTDIVITGGEIKPGVRSSETWILEIDTP